MQRKSEPPEAVAAEGMDLQDFMFPVNSPKLKELLERAKYSGSRPKDIIQLDETIAKLFRDAFEIEIRTYRRHISGK
jgi:hypothetical protein